MLHSDPSYQTHPSQKTPCQRSSGVSAAGSFTTVWQNPSHLLLLHAHTVGWPLHIVRVMKQEWLYTVAFYSSAAVRRSHDSQGRSRHNGPARFIVKPFLYDSPRVSDSLPLTPSFEWLRCFRSAGDVMSGLKSQRDSQHFKVGFCGRMSIWPVERALRTSSVWQDWWANG